MQALEFLRNTWVTIASVFGGVTIAGIVTAITYGVLKGATNRIVNKVNVQDIVDKATEKGTDKLRSTAFTHNIAPIVKSELKKVSEEANERIDEHLSKTEEKYDKLLNVLEKLSAYFDDSIGVPQTAKDGLKEAIAEAKTEKYEAVESRAEIAENEEPIAENEKAKTSLKVER